jgi:DnaJ-domain-containing protein 1
MAVGLAVLSLLSLRTGRFDVAMGLAIAAVAVASYGRREGSATGRKPPPASPGKMGTEEAYRVLGLPAGASEEEIKAAHRRLMLRAHPDLGGSNYLAAKLNEAKDVLLGR